MNYGKIVDGMFIKVEKYDNTEHKTIPLSKEEIKSLGVKEVVHGSDINPEEREGKRPVKEYSEQGEVIVARTRWVA